MPGPFNSKLFAAALEPFYDKRVAFAAERPDGTHRGTLAACIFDEGYAEVFDETSGTSSRIRQITLEVLGADWSAALSTPPQIGDRFTSPTTGRKYAAFEVKPTVGEAWSVTAREVKP